LRMKLEAAVGEEWVSTLSVKWASQICNPVIIVRMTRYLR